MVTKKQEELMVELLTSLGMDLNNESTKDTPRRFVKYLYEFHQKFDPEELLKATFDHVGFGGLISQQNIPFRMVCEHHLLPAWGKAHIGYVPNKKVLGLSKFSRLVQAVGTEKPGLQETICERIADLLHDHLEPKGVIVIIKAEHSCMACRGVNIPNVATASSAVRGLFLTNPEVRKEFFALIAMKGN